MAHAATDATAPAKEASVPRHLWIVGVLGLLWTAVGAFDYLATQLEYEPYMSQFSEEQLAYFYGFPAWVVSAWALGVWGGFFGCVALLLRRSWAVWLFGTSIVGMVGTTAYSYLLSEGAAVMGAGGVVFTAFIWVVAIALFFYARSQARKGVIR